MIWRVDKTQTFCKIPITKVWLNFEIFIYFSWPREKKECIGKTNFELISLEFVFIKYLNKIEYYL